MNGDGVYRRPGSPYYYYRLKINGKWKEFSSKERKLNAAKTARRAALQDQEEGRVSREAITRATFADVAAQYLRAASLRLRSSTLRKEGFFLRRPIQAFGGVGVNTIAPEHIRDLQHEMKAEGLKASYINLVSGAALRVLAHAKQSKRFVDDYRRLKEQEPPIARVLTADQKQRLFQVAASNQDWIVAYSAAQIAANTTMRGCELKGLRWRDVDLFAKELSVQESKSAAGTRRIPLNVDALQGFSRLLERSRVLNSADLPDFVFPACEHGIIDRSRHQNSWRTAWRKLTAAAGLAGLRFHDLRHQCITELAERGCADQTIMAIAGHVSPRMLRHYSQIRMEAKRSALDALVPQHKQAAEGIGSLH